MSHHSVEADTGSVLAAAFAALPTMANDAASLRRVLRRCGPRTVCTIVGDDGVAFAILVRAFGWDELDYFGGSFLTDGRGTRLVHVAELLELVARHPGAWRELPTPLTRSSCAALACTPIVREQLNAVIETAV